MSSFGHWPVILVEGILVAGGAFAFAWWQLRDLKKEARKRAQPQQTESAAQAQTPPVKPSPPIMLTDARANMSRDGTGGRAKAQTEALHAADQVRAAGIQAVLIDTSPQPQSTAFDLAMRMGARYMPMRVR